MRQADLELVIRDNFPRIHRAALVLTGNPWDADDLAQETFMVLATHPGKFKGKSSVYTWLYGILLNLDRRERRKLGTRQRKLRIVWEDGSRHATTSPPADAGLEASQWKQGLWSQVAELAEGQRHALVLRFSEGLPYDEIAQVLNCPLGTVKSRIFHGLANLRKNLDEKTEDNWQKPRCIDTGLVK